MRIMPRSTKEIIDQADALAQRVVDHVPGPSNLGSEDTLRQVREAFLGRARAESDLLKAVVAARSDGKSWSAIGTMVGTSGEAARQRYGAVVAKS
jgi:hypothetical protein